MKPKATAKREEYTSAHQLLAFLIVECNVSLPYKEALKMDQSDPLFQALVEAWQNKVRREREGEAFLASCIFNANGGKTKPSDFLPQTLKDRVQEENQLRANINAFNNLKKSA